MVSVNDGCAIDASAVLRDAIGVIESKRKSIAVVIDAAGRVVGTVSDGDIRRALLAGHSVESPVGVAMNLRPLTAPEDAEPHQLLSLLLESRLEAIPVVGPDSIYRRVAHRDELAGDVSPKGDCPFAAAVIMAGGEGKRLMPLTRATPKPMIDVGGMPLLERQIARLVQCGIRRVFLSINYLGHVIEQHFGDGERFGARIEYLREPSKMGTGGALSLLPRPVGGPLLVINGDIVTRSDFLRLGTFHAEEDAAITLGAVHHHVEIPFGVIDAKANRVLGIREKPSQRLLCNAGIYALSEPVLDLVTSETFLNMTDLVELALRAGRKVCVFPIYEFWSDVGTPQDLEAARRHVASLE
jgi:dTDP-glucose pyrophosphorylase/CBS domain-containing protein